jgi:hypothetical protein
MQRARDIDKLFTACQSNMLPRYKTCFPSLDWRVLRWSEGSEMLGSLIATVAAVAIALLFQIPLRGWLFPLVVADAISLIAGVLVGAFFGLYTAKRIVERRAPR